jgi:hypothetical protein
MEHAAEELAFLALIVLVHPACGCISRDAASPVTSTRPRSAATSGRQFQQVIPEYDVNGTPRRAETADLSDSSFPQ